MGKIVVAGSWLVGLVALLVLDPASQGAATARLLVGVLVGAHLIECIVFLPRLRRAGGSLPEHLARTFIFGLFHIRTLQDPGVAGRGRS